MNCELAIDNFVIQLNSRLLSHYASGNRRPLCVNFTNAFLGYHVDVKLLVLAQQHQLDWVFFLSLSICVLHWNHRVVRVNWHDILRRDFSLIAVFTDTEKSEVYRALAAHLFAGALLTFDIVVNLIGNQRDQTKSVGNEFIMQCRCVFSHLNQVNRHCWHF